MEAKKELEQKIREEARKAWRDQSSQDNEGGVNSVGFICGYTQGRLKSMEINEAKRKEALECLEELYSLACSWEVKNGYEREKMNNTIKAFLESLGGK